jgi:hypothetical protein
MAASNSNVSFDVKKRQEFCREIFCVLLNDASNLASADPHVRTKPP